MNTMDVSSSAPVSVGRNRLKTIARLVAGISFLCMMGGSGYLVYKKIQENISNTAAASPLDISYIYSDPCLNITSGMCNNGTEIDIVPALCECAEDGIWTIFQKRYDGSVGFYRNWADYKEGFGDLKGEYWLGNDAIHQITSSANYTLKIYLTDWDNATKYAMYDLFRIADEADGYRLTIGGYSGDAGDSMILNHNGKMFSTKDRDNGELPNANNAEIFHGAWWFDDNRLDSNLNGQYYFYPNDTLIANGIAWWEWLRDYGSGGFALKETKMMIHANK